MISRCRVRRAKNPATASGFICLIVSVTPRSRFRSRLFGSCSVRQPCKSRRPWCRNDSCSLQIAGRRRRPELSWFEKTGDVRGTSRPVRSHRNAMLANRNHTMSFLSSHRLHWGVHHELSDNFWVQIDRMIQDSSLSPSETDNLIRDQIAAAKGISPSEVASSPEALGP